MVQFKSCKSNMKCCKTFCCMGSGPGHVKSVICKAKRDANFPQNHAFCGMLNACWHACLMNLLQLQFDACKFDVCDLECLDVRKIDHHD
mmetsp:Transcript_33874/g.47246  ORF Transcript_33874/g.47246 Transcript_33874/m.47246 type:complete len:89 (+) Transcript_33874:372-638(+)